MDHVIHKTFQNTDKQTFTEEVSKIIYREISFKDCKVEKILSSLLRFQAGCQMSPQMQIYSYVYMATDSNSAMEEMSY